MIKNAGNASRETATFPYSKLKHAIAVVLEKEGFIKNVTKKTKKGLPMIEVTLVAKDGEPRIRDVKRVSKPSRRVYQGVADLRPYKQGHGMTILSTPKGILTDKEAKKEMVGGEVLFTIW